MEKRKQKQKPMKRNRMFSPMKATMLLLLLGFAAGNAMAQFRVEPKHRDLPQDNGLYINKSFEPDKDSEVTAGVLTLESYVTGEVKKISTSIPTDIVLVLDYSMSMASNMATTYTYTAQDPDDSYTYNSYDNSRYYKYGDDYCQVSRGRYYSSGYHYYLTFDHNGTTYYLSNSSGGVTTTRPSDITGGNRTIWTGVLYSRSTNPAVTRIEALKTAVTSFINAIYQDAYDHPKIGTHGETIPVDHRISIVKFSSDGVDVPVNDQTGLLNVVQYKDQMISAVNGIAANGRGTDHSKGLNLAFDNLPTPTLPLEKYNRKNVVVLFTDGKPQMGSASYNNSISAALPLKQDPTSGKAATVYSVGSFGNDVVDNDKKMLSYISSNYPNAQSLNNPGSHAADKYSITTDDPDQLNDIFEQIASESGGSTVDLGTQTVIQDVISDYFQLPEDADVDDIKVFTADCIGVDLDKINQDGFDSKGRKFSDVWDEMTIVPDEEEGYHLRLSGDNTTVQIDGFNFKENWCGLEIDEEAHVERIRGKKLILQIPIVVKEDAWGDGLPTNGPMSVISEDQDIIEEHIIGHFISPSQTVQRNTWVEAVTTIPPGWAADNIDSAEDLAWLISVVNGYNGCEAKPRTDATITADIDMSLHNWVPIGSAEGYYRYDGDGNPIEYVPSASETDGYTGIFDGGGHSITGLKNQPSKVFSAGLFGKVNGGTVKNTFVMDCDFNTGCQGHFGIIADTLCNGGVIYNCEAAGQLKSCKQLTRFLSPTFDPDDESTYYREVDPMNIYLGGLVGLVDASEVHSAISVAELYGFNMGGLVYEIRENSNIGAMENGYSYPTFFHWNPTDGGKVGGLVAVNRGKLLNCYIRERASDAEYSGGIQFALDRIDLLTPSAKDATMYKGLLVAQNPGSASYCYMTDEWWDGESLSQPFVGTGNAVASYGKFSATETPYMYKHNDNQVTMLGAKEGEPATEGLLAKLNGWVSTPTRGSYTYTTWFRTTADGINNDYPVLKIMDFNSVGSDDLVRLYYGNINDMMGSTSMYTSGKADDTYCIYQNAAVTTGNNDATLYINEDVAITQTTSLDAYVGITLDNSAHPDGGASQSNPNDPAQHEYGENTRDWHMFSTSLSDAPLGVNYTDNTQYAFFYDNTPQALSINMPKYAFNDESVEDGYFPSHRYGKESDDEEYNYYKEWDYYCWSEPYNHWINFKRNSASHWAENIQDLNLGYTNEPTLTPGKGYLLAIANETFLQSHGTLNQGDVTVPLTYSRMNEMSRGFNFVGNPYQSYLDFDAFANENPGITSYTLLDEDEGAYVTYAATASRNSKSASQFINMHQGFLVFTDGSVEEVTFTESMRDIEATTTTFRGGEKASFTLVNIILTESDGKREIVTVETGRPEQGGARKMMGLLNGKSQLYAHCDGESYSVLFATDEMHTVPVRFRTYQDDSFTLTWDVENGSLDELYLVDNITGQTVDMLTHSQYVFEGRTTDFSSRFKLVFGNGTVDEPAEGEVIEDIFAYQNEDNLMVTSEGHFEMYDMSGRLVQCVNLYNDFNTVALPRMSRGVYTLRLTNNTDTKVQKIVIR